MAWTHSAHTALGLALRQKQVERDIPLKFTKAVAGSGMVNPAELVSQTGLVSQKQIIDLGDVIYTEPDNSVLLPVTLRNEGVQEGYNVEQVGVYAEDPDLGEILYFISQSDQAGGDAVPSETRSPGHSIDWNFKLKVANASKIEVVVSEVGRLTIEQADARYAKKEDLEKLEDKVDNLDISGQLTEYVKTSEMNQALANYYTKEETYNRAEIDQKIGSAGGGSIIVSDSAPEGNSSAIWVDTAAGGVHKYWNGTAWVPGKAVWG